MARVTGPGGIFCKVADTAATQKCYQDNLGVGGDFADLAVKGISVLGRQDEDYGRLAWILDPDRIKVELFQQIGGAPQ